MRFVQFVRDRLETLSSLLDGRYKLAIEYESKISDSDPEGSIREYLLKNRDRDVLL